MLYNQRILGTMYSAVVFLNIIKLKSVCTAQEKTQMLFTWSFLLLCAVSYLEFGCPNPIPMVIIVLAQFIPSGTPPSRKYTPQATLTSEYFYICSFLILLWSNVSVVCCRRTVTHFVRARAEMRVYIEGCSLLMLPWALKGVCWFIVHCIPLGQMSFTPLCHHTYLLPSRQESQ